MVVEDIREIRRRMLSIRNTRQITAAMETVAAAKVRRAKARLEDSRPYVSHLQEALRRILQNAPALEHPFLAGAAAGQEGPVKRGFLVITSDRGLNGGYNSVLLRKCLEAMAGEKEPFVLVVGRKGRDFWQRQGIEIIGEYVGLPDDPPWEKAVEISMRVRQFFLEGVFQELHLAYNEFVTALQQRPVLKALLPLSAAQELSAGEVPAGGVPAEEGEAYQFEPSASQALGALLPHYIDSLVFGALLEAKAAEHGARMAAMGAASGNAKDMLQKLSLRFNRARQGAITAEILEVVGGSGDLP